MPNQPGDMSGLGWRQALVKPGRDRSMEDALGSIHIWGPGRWKKAHLGANRAAARERERRGKV